MKECALVLVTIFAAACSSGPAETPAPQGYRGIEEVRILAKGME